MHNSMGLVKQLHTKIQTCVKSMGWLSSKHRAYYKETVMLMIHKTANCMDAYKETHFKQEHTTVTAVGLPWYALFKEHLL